MRISFGLNLTDPYAVIAESKYTSLVGLYNEVGSAIEKMSDREDILAKLRAKLTDLRGKLTILEQSDYDIVTWGAWEGEIDQALTAWKNARDAALAGETDETVRRWLGFSVPPPEPVPMGWLPFAIGGGILFMIWKWR